MINITRGNDFKLAVTFTRGGEAYSFDSITSVSLLGTLDVKYSQAFSYSGGKLTVNGSHSIPAGVYGMEIIGKEGNAVRRTAFPRVIALTNNTTAGSYDPAEDVDEYDIAIHVELDLTVEKTETTDTGSTGTTETKTTEDTETKTDGSTTSEGGSSSDTGTEKE